MIKPPKATKEEIERSMTEYLKSLEIKTKCDVCGELIYIDKIGNGNGCSKCGWVQDKLSQEWPGRVVCPNLIPLNKARKLYKENKPFVPDFEDFISGYMFFGEMQFTYNKTTYGVTGGEDEVNLWIVDGDEIAVFSSVDDFAKNAEIEGKRLKDIWKDVKDANWLQ